jgi:hypothetical protein
MVVLKLIDETDSSESEYEVETYSTTGNDFVALDVNELILDPIKHTYTAQIAIKDPNGNYSEWSDPVNVVTTKEGTLFLTGLGDFPYDGDAHEVTGTFQQDPNSVTVNVMYNGSPNPPSAIGSYNVVGSIDHYYWTAQEEVGTLNITIPGGGGGGGAGEFAYIWPTTPIVNKLLNIDNTGLRPGYNSINAFLVKMDGSAPGGVLKPAVGDLLTVHVESTDMDVYIEFQFVLNSMVHTVIVDYGTITDKRDYTVNYTFPTGSNFSSYWPRFLITPYNAGVSGHFSLSVTLT